ncbi:hypothetical protein BRC85_00725 [Halobacteriales archaeon QS_1_69_70]|nr:MAG: hypothetical protein BRC85_00725 [Halobacteriales archaeon QS_1_69_70]
MLSGRVTAAAVVGAVLVGIGVGLFVYSPADGASPMPFEETDPAGAYEATASLTTDGRTFLEYTARADPDRDRQYVQRAFEDVTYTIYWNGSHRFTRVDADTYEDYERSINRTDEASVVWRDDDALEAVTVQADDRPPLAKQSQPEGLIGSVVGQPGYERAGTATHDGQEVAVYRPTGGWYEARSDIGGGADVTYRITNAEGELHVDGGTALRATLRFEIAHADSWGEYLLATYVADERHTVDVTYDYDPGPADVEAPDWTTRP